MDLVLQDEQVAAVEQDAERRPGALHGSTWPDRRRA